MIRSDAEEAQAIEVIRDLRRTIAALREEIAPLNHANYLLLAEGPRAEIARIMAELREFFDWRRGRREMVAWIACERARRKAESGMKTITELTNGVHETAQSHGWWEEWDQDAPITEVEQKIAQLVFLYGSVSNDLEDLREGRLPSHSLPDAAGVVAAIKAMSTRKVRTLVKLALIHSEVDEAVEACLNDQLDMTGGSPLDDMQLGDGVTIDKPEGMVVELADVVIRIMDLCGKLDLPLEAALLAKARYNEQRPYKHGGKRA